MGHYHGGFIKEEDFDSENSITGLMSSSGRKGKSVKEWMDPPEVKEAELSEAEFAAVRFYTSSSCPHINNPWRSREMPHPWRFFVANLDSGTKKLRACLAQDLNKFQSEQI